MRWLATHVRGLIALAAVLTPLIAAAFLGYVVLEERAERDAIHQQFVEAAETREQLAVERAERAEESVDRLSEFAAELVEESAAERRAEHAEILQLLEGMAGDR